MNFIYQSFPIKIYFGQGQLEKINDIIHQLHGSRLFVVAISMVNDLMRSFGKENILHFSTIARHVPKIVAEEAQVVNSNSKSQIDNSQFTIRRQHSSSLSLISYWHDQI